MIIGDQPVDPLDDRLATRRRGSALRVPDSIPRPTLRRRGTTPSRARGCRSAGSQMRGPSRVAAFPLVGFGAKVVSGSSDNTMAISSPGSRSEARDGRR